ncbi:MAG: hypothetical protein ACXAEU_04700 [Candidatus Hodarchaeales archaeon]
MMFEKEKTLLTELGEHQGLFPVLQYSFLVSIVFSQFGKIFITACCLASITQTIPKPFDSISDFYKGNKSLSGHHTYHHYVI